MLIEIETVNCYHMYHYQIRKTYLHHLQHPYVVTNISLNIPLIYNENMKQRKFPFHFCLFYCLVLRKQQHYTRNSTGE